MIPILAFGMPATPEWIFLGILALVLFGPKKLPELARGFGKAMGELQKAKEEFQREISQVPPLPQIKEPAERQSYQAPLASPLEVKEMEGLEMEKTAEVSKNLEFDAVKSPILPSSPMQMSQEKDAAKDSRPQS